MNIKTIISFLVLLIILFMGFCLCNTIVITIDCLFEDFDHFGARILDLPFLLYLFFSLALSTILTIVIQRKTK